MIYHAIGIKLLNGNNILLATLKFVFRVPLSFMIYGLKQACIFFGFQFLVIKRVIFEWTYDKNSMVLYLAGNASVTNFFPIERESANWFRFSFWFRRFWHNELKFSELTLIWLKTDYNFFLIIRRYLYLSNINTRLPVTIGPLFLNSYWRK